MPHTTIDENEILIEVKENSMNPLEDRRSHVNEPEDKNILKVLSDMQSQINSLKSERAELLAKLEKSDGETLLAQSKHAQIVDLLNQFRLGVYIPASFDAIDANEMLRKFKFNLTEIASKDLEQAQRIHSLIISLAAESADLVEDARAKAPIKLERKQKDKDKLNEVKKQQEAQSPEAKLKKIVYSEAEKIINGFRKRAPKATVTQLIPLIQAMSPIKDVAEIRALFDSIFAKEQSKKSKS